MGKMEKFITLDEFLGLFSEAQFLTFLLYNEELDDYIGGETDVYNTITCPKEYKDWHVAIVDGPDEFGNLCIHIDRP